MLRQLAWMVIDALRRGEEPELFVSQQRINDEDRRAHHLGLEEDVSYRKRVMQRMKEGKDCTLPPLYNAPKKPNKPKKNVVAMRPREGKREEA